MKVPLEFHARVQDRAAQLGVKPQTLVKAALRRGLEEVVMEDVEAEMSRADQERRQRERAAEKAREVLERAGV